MMDGNSLFQWVRPIPHTAKQVITVSPTYTYLQNSYLSFQNILRSEMTTLHFTPNRLAAEHQDQ